MIEFSNIPLEELGKTYDSNFVSRSTSSWPELIAARLNEGGFATFDGMRSPADLLGFAAIFGEVRVHPQTDEQGITTMIASDKYKIENGIVETPANEQLFHTDGSKMPEPPGAVAIYCEAPDPHIPRVNVFAHAGTLFEKLKVEDPELLSALCKPIDFGDVKSAIFTSNENGLMAVRFRQAPEPPKMGLADELRYKVDMRLRQPDILQGVTLKEGQGVIFNNNSVLHGLGASKGIGRIARRVQITLKPDSPIEQGFRVKD